jgi:ketosteroid isomerase-like protein
MKSDAHDPISVIDRLVRATNAHDIDQIVACFADDYALEAPNHPARSFRGNDQVRRNWAQIFAGVPDISTKVVQSAVQGDTVWTEWEMTGTRRDGAPHSMKGVFIFRIVADRIHAGRMFLEPVERSGTDMDAAVRDHVAAR